MTASEVVDRARALIADERPQDAQDVLAAFLVDQDHPGVWMVLARVYLLLDDVLAARAIFRNVVLKVQHPHIMNIIAAKIPYGKPLVLDNLRLIYFNIPKCGSSSLKDAILLAHGQERRGESSHFHVGEFEKVVPFTELRQQYKGYKTFAVVRHPRDRLRSYYARNIIKAGSLRQESGGKDSFYGLNTTPTYLEVVRQFQRYRNVFSDFRHHTDSIIGYVGLDKNRLDSVFDLPQVPDAVRLIQEASGVSMPHIHNMQAAEDPVEIAAEDKSDEDMLIASFYKKEVELFFQGSANQSPRSTTQ